MVQRRIKSDVWFRTFEVKRGGKRYNVLVSLALLCPDSYLSFSVKYEGALLQEEFHLKDDEDLEFQSIVIQEFTQRLAQRLFDRLIDRSYGETKEGD